MSNYDDAAEQFEELLVEQPARAMAWLAQVAAQQAVEQQAGPLIQQSYENGRQLSEGLANGLVESNYLAANEKLVARYGDEWVKNRDAVVQTINDEGLMSDEAAQSA